MTQDARDEQEAAGLRFTIGKMAGIVESLPGRMDRMENSMHAHLHDLGARVTTLEGNQRRVTGTASLLSACFGALVGWFLPHIAR